MQHSWQQQPNTKMLLVGLTGGIATGKSTVTAWFRTKNVAVIDCDALVHDLQKPARAARGRSTGPSLGL